MWYLLRESGVAEVLGYAVVFPVLEDIPPPPLEGPEHGNVQRLENVSRILREETEPETTGMVGGTIEKVSYLMVRTIRYLYGNLVRYRTGTGIGLT